MSEHILYTADDFTQEEIERENILAVHAIDQGLSICKVCGKAESELRWSCDTKLNCAECHEALADNGRAFCLKCYHKMTLARRRQLWAGLGWVRYT